MVTPWDHPRMCGEHLTDLTEKRLALGSSPHVRGAPSVGRTRLADRGIIPACAGSTTRRRPPRHGTRDHPRMCGEHRTTAPRASAASGSSPHVRGALADRGRRHPGRGIIPACAGSTACGLSTRCNRRDHPRMCGEHKLRQMNGLRSPGLSPHMRGARHSGDGGGVLQGIIPACAGSTPSGRRGPRRSRDHPRMCGEHPFHAILSRRKSGSSPHVRGAQMARKGKNINFGIIPACAGST